MCCSGSSARTIKDGKNHIAGSRVYSLIDVLEARVGVVLKKQSACQCGLRKRVCFMEQAQDLIERMSAVTISREYGSGGGEIAQRLAQHLNWHSSCSGVRSRAPW